MASPSDDQAARSRRSSPRSTTTARSTSTRSARLIDWQLEHGHARDLGRRLDRRADLADGRRAHRGHADGGGGDRRPRPVPARHRHRAAGRDARADRRGRSARRAGRARRRALLRAPAPSRACSTGTAAVASEFPDLPIIVYNVPIRSAVDITPETVGPAAPRAREHRRDQGDDARLRARLLRARHCGTDFIALSGIELLCYPMLALGGDGHLSAASANFAPRPVARALRRVRRRATRSAARRLHYELHPLVDAAFAETNPVPAKWIMERLGVLPSAHVRAPLAPLSEASAHRIEELLAEQPARQSRCISALRSATGRRGGAACRG